MLYNRYSVLGMTLGLIALIVIVTVWAPNVVAQRKAASARECAQGVVAAAARGDVLELESRFGRELSTNEVGELRAQVPSALGVDPKRYNAPFFNPLSTGSATVQVQSPDDVTFAVLVTLEQADSFVSWRVISLQRVTPK